MQIAAAKKNEKQPNSDPSKSNNLSVNRDMKKSKSYEVKPPDIVEEEPEEEEEDNKEKR